MLALQLHPDDNVAVATANLSAGTPVSVSGITITLCQDIPFGHKFACEPIRKLDAIRKYGRPIGRAVVAVTVGEHVHGHNCESTRERWHSNTSEWGKSAIDSCSLTSPTPEDVDKPSLSTFLGYRRRNGRVGLRNHVLVLSTVHCANAVVERLGRATCEIVALPHIYGCSQIGEDLDQSRRVLEAIAGHPNVGACLLVGLGCETMPTVEMFERLAAQGKLVRYLIIQEEGGCQATYEQGLGIVEELVKEASGTQQEPIPLSELVVGVECGGSDAWSGVTANPAVGIASDLVVAAGGTVILSEVTEFIGAEFLLTPRCVSASVARKILEAVKRREEWASKLGIDMRGGQPTPGNILGGLTTIEEKSLGAITKGGSSPVQEVLAYGREPSRKGLVVMDTAGNDPESVTAMVAGGAQIVVFTTGRGSPTGCPIAPVIKVASNTPMYRRLQDDMDINAGTVLEGKPLAEVGQRIFQEIVDVASGKLTTAEKWGHQEFAIETLGPRV